MTTTVKARYSAGSLKLSKPLDLEEGAEVTVDVHLPDQETATSALERTAGGWAGLIDAEEFLRLVYESRLRSSRPAPEL